MLDTLPCPFCGRQPKWDYGTDDTRETTKHFRLYCDCDVKPSTAYCIIDCYPFDKPPRTAEEAEHAAITIWNTRKP